MNFIRVFRFAASSLLAGSLGAGSLGLAAQQTTEMAPFSMNPRAAAQTPSRSISRSCLMRPLASMASSS